MEKYSFIKDIMGHSTYEGCKECARRCIPIATIVLIIVYVLTNMFHWTILSFILNLTTGTSLVFLAYIVGVVLLLDYGVVIEPVEHWDGTRSMPEKKPQEYETTKIWGITLIILAIAAIYFTNKYRKQYAFECETVLVDPQKGIYHLDGYNEDCEEITEYTHLYPMKGYKAEELHCTFCPACEEWVEDAKSDSY